VSKRNEFFFHGLILEQKFTVWDRFFPNTLNVRSGPKFDIGRTIAQNGSAENLKFVGAAF
jgi:hypothetical protein